MKDNKLFRISFIAKRSFIHFNHKYGLVLTGNYNTKCLISCEIFEISFDRNECYLNYIHLNNSIKII